MIEYDKLDFLDFFDESANDEGLKSIDWSKDNIWSKRKYETNEWFCYFPRFCEKKVLSFLAINPSLLLLSIRYQEINENKIIDYEQLCFRILQMIDFSMANTLSFSYGIDRDEKKRAKDEEDEYEEGEKTTTLVIWHSWHLPAAWRQNILHCTSFSIIFRSTESKQWIYHGTSLIICLSRFMKCLTIWLEKIVEILK